MIIILKHFALCSDHMALSGTQHGSRGVRDWSQVFCDVHERDPYIKQ